MVTRHCQKVTGNSLDSQFFSHARCTKYFKFLFSYFYSALSVRFFLFSYHFSAMYTHFSACHLVVRVCEGMCPEINTYTHRKTPTHTHTYMHPYYDSQSRLLKSQLTYFCTVRARKKRTGNASEEIHTYRAKQV